MKDELGKRMKENFEMRTRTYLPRRTYTIIRLDGKAFHTFTKGLDRPADRDFMWAMNETARFLCTQIQGAKFAYVQSDEISILLTDFEKPTTDSWFDGQVQKIVSVAASIATYKFNEVINSFIDNHKQDKWLDGKGLPRFGLFDARVFTIPDPTEVGNYFIWRQKDATRNSLSMMAQSHFSHKELHGKSQSDMHDMLHVIGENWNDMDAGFKQGRLIKKVVPVDIETPGEVIIHKSEWITKGAFDFVKEREELNDIMPMYED